MKEGRDCAKCTTFLQQIGQVKDNLTIGYTLSTPPVKNEHCVCMLSSLYVQFELSVMFS